MNAGGVEHLRGGRIVGVALGPASRAADGAKDGEVAHHVAGCGHYRRPVGGLRGRPGGLYPAAIDIPASQVIAIDAGSVAGHHLQQVVAVYAPHLAPVVQAVQIHPPFRQAVAVLVISTVHRGKVVALGFRQIGVGKGLLNIQVVVPV